MERDYDLFERSQYNSPVWRGSVHGLENAGRKLREPAKRTTNECFAIYSPTRQIVALLHHFPIRRSLVVYNCRRSSDLRLEEAWSKSKDT